MRWLGCPQTCLVGVELQRNGQPIFCRPKVSLKVKSLDVLLSVLRLHGRLLGLLITIKLPQLNYKTSVIWLTCGNIWKLA